MIYFEGLKTRDFESIVVSVINEAKCILDIGCGIGNYLKLTNSNQRVVAVEPHKPYIDEAQKAAPWAEFHNTDGIDFFQNNKEKFDCILLIDVVEHLESEKALQLIEFAKEASTDIVISLVPFGIHHQEKDFWNLGGEFWQTHRSTWDYSNYHTLGFNIKHVWKNWYDHSNEENKTNDTILCLWLNDLEKKSLKILVDKTYPINELISLYQFFYQSNIPYFLVDIEIVENSAKRFYSNIIIDDDRFSFIRNPLPENYDFIITNPVQISETNFQELFLLKFPSISKNEPVFSIIIPIYNHAGFIIEALETVRKQRIQNWEAIIVNDGSTDNSVEVINNYIKDDTRFRLISKENGGVSSALNSGIREAKGEWICWLSSDDWFETNKLEIHLKHINMNPGIKFFHTKYSAFYQNTGQLNRIEADMHKNLPPAEFQILPFFKWNPIAGNSICIHRSVFNEIGMFKEELRIGQDYDFWLRVSTKFRIYFIPEFTCITRWHDEMGTVKFPEAGIWDSTRSLIDFINKNNLESLFPFFDLKNLQNLNLIINNILEISLTTDAFLYQGVGFITPILDRLLEFLCKIEDQELKSKISNQFINITSILEKNNIPFEILNSIRRFSSLNSSNFTYKKYEILAAFLKNRNNLSEKGDLKSVDLIDKYLAQLRKTDNLALSSYIPLKFDWITKQYNNTSELVDALIYRIGNQFIFEFFIKKSDDTKISFRTEVPFISSFKPFIALQEKTKEHFYVNPLDFLNKFSRNYNYDKSANLFNQKFNADLKPTVAFTLLTPSAISGGISNILKYANTLVNLGIEVTIYADEPKPAFFDFKGKYVHQKIDAHYVITEDVIIVYSILELPRILYDLNKNNKINHQKIIHLCQGNEEFHYGDTRNGEIIKPKDIFRILHSIPAGRIVVSPHLEQYFFENHGQNCFRITNSYNDEIFKKREDRKIGTDVHLLTIGNPLHPLKGALNILKAIYILKNKNLKYRFILTIISPVNFSEKLAEIQDIRVTGLFQQENVNILTNLSHVEILKYYQEADIYINSSYYEGFGLPSIEAMAVGVPVIQADNYGLNGIVEDNVNVLLFNPDSYEEISEKIIKIVENDDLRKYLIENGFSTAGQFTRDRQNREFVSVFSKILNIDLSNLDDSKAKIAEPEIIEKETINKINPKFSVLVPTYNHAHYIPEALDSLINQSYDNWEVIVVNDGSKDNTIEVVQEYIRRDIRIKLYNKLNGGTGSALNEGIRNASGEWICWLSSDDFYEPSRLEVLTQYIQENPDIKFFHNHYYYLDLNNSKSEPGIAPIPETEFQLLQFFKTNYINGISICIHKSVFDEVGLFNEKYYFAQDFDMWLKIAAKYEFYYIHERLCTTRFYDEQISLVYPERGILDSCNALIEFLKNIDFRSLLPFTDFDNDASVNKAMKFIFELALNPGLLLYQGIGLRPILIDKLLEWYQSNDCSPTNKQQIIVFVNAIELHQKELNIPVDLISNFNQFHKDIPNYKFPDYNFIEICKRNIEISLANNQNIIAEKLQSYLKLLNEKNEKYRNHTIENNANVNPENYIKPNIPECSVIIPTFNRPKLLSEAINSVLNQTFQNFEIIVVNDAGEDVSDIINSFNDSHIKYIIHKDNKGISAARNTGISNSSGKYISYLDDDDLLLPHHLKTLHDFLNNSEFKAAYTDAERITYKDKESLFSDNISNIDIPYSQDFDTNRILYSNFIPTLCIMHEKACLSDIELFDENLESHEDWDFWIRISRKHNFVHIPEVTCSYRYVENKESLSGNRVNMFYTALAVLKKTQKYVDLQWIYDERLKFITWFMHDAGIKNIAGFDKNFNPIQNDPVNYNPTQTLPTREGLSQNQDLSTSLSTFEDRIKESSEIIVSFIIITHNNVKVTKICLDSIFSTCTKFKFEIIIVDNDSNDETRDYLDELSKIHDNIKIKFNDSNESFSKANNDGFALSSGKYLVFMNNDISLFENSIESLIDIFDKKNDIAIQGAKLLYPSNLIQHCGIVYGYITPKILTHQHIYINANEDSTYVNQSREYQFVTGAMLAIRREIFENAGRFDENYFYGHEDLDLCLKVRKLGYKIWYNSKIVAYHFESITKKSIGLEKFESYIINQDSYDYKNELYFRNKWKDYIKIDADDYYAYDGFYNLIFNIDLKNNLMTRLDKVKESLIKALSYNDDEINFRLVEMLNIDNKPLSKGKQEISLNRMPIEVLENLEKYLSNIPENNTQSERIEPKRIVTDKSKPKILYTMFGWNESGGGTILPKSMAIELAKAGFEIRVFYAGLKHPQYNQPYYFEQSEDSGVTLYGLFNREREFFMQDRPDLEIRDESVLPYFEKVLNEFKPDILHIHSILGLSFSIVEIAKSKGIKVIYTTHNYYFMDPRLYMFNSNLEHWKGTDFWQYSELPKLYPEKISQYRERMVYGKSILKNNIDLTLAVSNRVKELLVNFGADTNKIKVINQIPPGIELLKNSYKERFEIHSPIRFGFIGTAIPQKGVHTIIAAASLIAGNNIEFHIYGFGVSNYLNEMKKFDKSNKITWHGEYNFNEFPDIADNIDAIIIPSIWEDCAPLVVVEALAMGLPVIGANIGGIPDFIENGINGILFQSGNHVELANIIIDLIKNPQKLIEMRKNVKVNLTFSDFMKKIIEIYTSDIDKVEDWKFYKL